MTTNDAWLRDSAPSFVVNDARGREFTVHKMPQLLIDERATPEQRKRFSISLA